MVHVEWDKVTWYSKLIALFVFLATFAIGFDLGIVWEQARIASFLSIVPPSVQAPIGQVTPSGDSVQTTAASTTEPAVLTPGDNGKTVTLTVHEPFTLDFGSALSWSFVFNPPDAISRTANGNEYQAIRAGTTTLTAVGRPICMTGKMCPQFIRAVSITLVAVP